MGAIACVPPLRMCEASTFCQEVLETGPTCCVGDAVTQFCTIYVHVVLKGVGFPFECTEAAYAALDPVSVFLWHESLLHGK